MPALQEPQLVETVALPQHYQPATARERRGQAMNRLQLGVGGIVAMLLIVGLANIIMERARQNDSAAAVAPGDARPLASKASDALADIGLVPSPDPSATPTGRNHRH